MNTYSIRLTCLSHALIGSGEGFGAVIDADIMFDDVGIPYIPAKRVKGCLREAAVEARDMLQASGLPSPIDIDTTFGTNPAEHSDKNDEPELVQGAVRFSNLMIDDYAQNYDWLNYLLHCKDEKDRLSKQEIVNAFTAIRQQTAIDKVSGVAYDHSLRTVRVLKRDNSFSGVISVNGVKNEAEMKPIIHTLALACRNLRRIGTSRNRGFGDVICQLVDSKGVEIPFEQLLTMGGDA